MVFDLEVDVVRDRSSRPWRSRTHHVSVQVDDQLSWSRAENEARNLAVGMCGSARGEMVIAVRIVAVEV